MALATLFLSIMDISSMSVITIQRSEMNYTPKNIGISIVASTMQITSEKDKNPIFGELCCAHTVSPLHTGRKRMPVACAQVESCVHQDIIVERLD